MLINFSTLNQNKRYYYRESTGEFHETTTDNAMFDCKTDPYIVREDGWPKHNYRMVDGELVHNPIELVNVSPRG